MKLILNVGFAAFILLAVVFIIMYLPRLAAWFACARPQKKLKSEKQHKIALIVPARNESKVIGDFLASVGRQSYSEENFGLHVIVKEHDDPAIDTVQKAGGTIYIASHQTRKGDALDYCLKTILEKNPDEYDAYLIIDADCMLADDYLEQMNNALSSGKQVIQSKRVVKNYLMGKKALSTSACCNGLIWTIIDGLGNRYKSDKGITCMTIGTGIMLRSDVVKTLGGWPYKATLTEDMELMNDCAIRKFSTFYYSYARLYLEESTNIKVTNKRRTRWLTGVVDSKRLYQKQLKKSVSSKEERCNRYFVTALWPVFYLIGTCVLFSIGFFGVAVTLFILGNTLWLRALIMSAIALCGIYVLFLILTVFCLIVDRKEILLPWYKKAALLFVHPLFYMGYIPIIAKALIFKNHGDWEVIDRIDVSMQAKEIEQ